MKPTTPRSHLRPDGIPTRCDIRLTSTTENAIRDAIGMVESIGADKALTDAVVLLDEAKNRVADYLEGLPDKPTLERPKIVCICGSSRFVCESAVRAWELEKQGILALGMHLLPAWYGETTDHLAEHEGVAHVLDALHLKKIEMADSVLVLNVGGYIGERTKIEIEHAKKLRKPIEYLEPL
jgi:hypothetical protein